MRALAREPLVHFLALGGLLFALDHVARSRADATGRVIVVDESVRAELADQWAHAHGAPPSADELDALTERWIDDEVLYREGLERGLDLHDPRIRMRVAAAMQFVLEEQVAIPEPSDAELRAFFE